MSYHDSRQEWRDNKNNNSYHDDDEYGAHHSSSGVATSPFQDNPGLSVPGPVSPSRTFSNSSDNNNNNNSYRSPQQPHEQYSHQPSSPGFYHDEDEQYPVGRPLSYFPTHHQPLSQQEYDDEQLRTSQYHQMNPMEHAHSPLSNRSPAWGGGGYSGYQAQGSIGSSSNTAAPTTDIPLVGIDIISSNLDAVRNGNKFSDTRTGEDEANYNRAGGSMYSTGAGVGNNIGHNLQNQQYNQYDNKHGYNNQSPDDPNRSSQYDPSQQQYQQQPPPAVLIGQDGEPIPKALLDPKVQRQLSKRKTWKPWFIWFVSAVQIAMLVFEFVKGYQRTGQIIETSPFNPMIGPGSGTIIVTGARFVPCMRSTYLDDKQIQCPDNTTQICTITDICGFTPIASTGKPPNQWFRFITPIFLHGGIVHLLFNLAFQLRTGADLERDMGWWRIGIIYMCSGIVGFIFGGNFAPLLSPSMGGSGAIFGLIGCLVLDLIQNWKLVVRPCFELTKLTFMILFSFAFGLLPFLDNFAHIGGFFTGILTGLVFMPVVYFSKRDKYIKWGLRVVALPLVVLIIVLGLTNFYKGANNCSWCRYLSCLPINGWCDAFNPPAGSTTTGTAGN
ncbi:hypothetical protein BGX26_005252 [Mortierella sp. AD094]|nr:hypothetical protein BGX26_005252 [Mortierella sp. AD094]